MKNESKYSTEKRDQALKLLLQPGRSRPSVAKELGVPVSAVRYWAQTAADHESARREARELLTADREVQGSEEPENEEPRSDRLARSPRNPAQRSTTALSPVEVMTSAGDVITGAPESVALLLRAMRS